MSLYIVSACMIRYGLGRNFIYYLYLRTKKYALIDNGLECFLIFIAKSLINS